MAILRIGTFTATGSAFNLNLGFVPSYFQLTNQTKLAAQTGVAISEWWKFQLNGAANIQTLSAGAPTYSTISSNGFTPFVSSDAQLYTQTNRVVTAITKAVNAQVTSTAHGFTAADVGVTTVTFHGVVGMTQINTLTGVIQSIVDANNFTVNINTTSFTSYVSGGIANVVTGIPPVTQTGFQVYNTPLLNIGFLGITVGSSVAGTAADVLYYKAFLDADFTSQ